MNQSLYTKTWNTVILGRWERGAMEYCESVTIEKAVQHCQLQFMHTKKTYCTLSIVVSRRYLKAMVLIVSLLLKVLATCKCILGQICLNHCICYWTKVEVADQTGYLTQSQCTDNWPTNSSSNTRCQAG